MVYSVYWQVHRFAPGIVALAFAIGGCGLFDSDDPIPVADTVMLTFRLEAETLPDGGWGYWYVHEGILYSLNAGQSFGPFGTQADCGSHAGIDARLTEAAEADARLALVIEIVDPDADEPSVSRKEFAGPGLHQTAVLISCP